MSKVEDLYKSLVVPVEHLILECSEIQKGIDLIQYNCSEIEKRVFAAMKMRDMLASKLIEIERETRNV